MADASPSRAPIDPSPADISRHLEELHRIAGTAPQAAQDAAWSWLADLGRADDQTTLAALFGQGHAAQPRARTAGMPVGPMRHVFGTRLVSAYLRLDSPWTGKTFRADGTGGHNRVKRYARPIVALLAPGHPLRREIGEYACFPFTTSIQPGVVSPRVDVLAIEYDRPEHRNPSTVFPLTRIRDELVEILPHTYLGRATWPQRTGEYVVMGYFALKRSVGGIA